MECTANETIILIGGSVENSFCLFGYKETEATLKRKVDSAEVRSVESTTVSPQFSLYPPGNRLYKLQDWDDLGFMSAGTSKNEDLFNLENKSSILKSGEVPILPVLYIAIRDFNPDSKEQAIGDRKI